MANYNKSFNFKNGVQVDTDKFIVNTAGLVGIGSTLPTDFLDVQGGATVTGDIKVTGGDITVTGLVTSSQLNVSGISTVGFLTSNSDAYVSGVVTATKFYGDGSFLSNIVGFTTESWNVVRASGASADRTGLTTTSKIGIGTTEANNSYDLIIGSDPLTAGNEGISFDGSTGNIRSSNIITADYFAGDVNAGIITGTLQTAAQGNVTSLGTLSVLDVGGHTELDNVNVSGVSTFTGNVSFGSSALFGDNKKAYFGDDGDLGIYHTGSNGIVTNRTGQLQIQTPQFGIVGGDAANYNLYCVENAQIQLYYAGDKKLETTDKGVAVSGNTETQTLNVSGVGSFGSIGIGTTTPTVDFQLRRDAAATNATLQVISEKGTAIVAVGDSESLTGHTGQFRYGHTTGSFKYSDEISLDIINYSRGSINNILNPTLQTGIGTGNFNWLVGSSVDPDMTLTYQGKLGIGQTLPDHTLHVVGTSTVTTDAYVGNNLEVGNNLTVKGATTFTSALTASLKGDILSPNGANVIFDNGTGDGADSQLNVGIFTATTSVKTGTAEITRLGIGTLPDEGDYPLKINVNPSNRVYAHTSGDVGIGTDLRYDNVNVAIPNGTVFVGGKLGIGNSTPFCALDVGTGGTATTRYMRPPQVTDGERVGLVTTLGALVYNITSNTLQVYTGNSTGWKTVTVS